MKFTRIQTERLVRTVLKALQDHNVMELKAPEEKIFKSAVDGLEKLAEKERQLDRDANALVDDLERKNPGGFERRKMFLMIRKRLAEERKIVL